MITPDDFKRWLRQAKPGDKLVIPSPHGWLKEFHDDDRICIFRLLDINACEIQFVSEYSRRKLDNLAYGPDLLSKRTWK